MSFLRKLANTIRSSREERAVLDGLRRYVEIEYRPSERACAYDQLVNEARR